MRTLLRTVIPVSAVALCLSLLGSAWSQHRNNSRKAPSGLHLEVVSRDAHIGIPGQTKMYSGHLSNKSTAPIHLPACDYVDDAFNRGVELPYAVQRWDGPSNSWQTIVEASGRSFCRPYPLGKVETRRITMSLLPGETVEAAGEEATGAREPFRKGDKARFVVFTKFDNRGDWQTAVFSAPFIIEDDVIRDDESPSRVRH